MSCACAKLDDLFSAAEVLARHPRLTGERLAILTNGGGAGVLATDHLTELGGRLANLSGPATTALDAVLPPTWSHGNPVDIIGDADPARYQRALEAILDHPGSDAILVMNCPTALSSGTAVAEAVLTTLGQRKQSGKPSKPVLTNWLGDGASRDARALFATRGIASFTTPAEAIDGFMQLVRYARAQEELMRTPPSLAEDLGFDTEAAHRTIAQVLAAGRAVLSEIEAKALLAAYGIPVVPTDVAASPAEVGRLAARWIGEHGACVVKVLSDDLTHKSDEEASAWGSSAPRRPSRPRKTFWSAWRG